MNKINEFTLRILTILSENLKHPQPQVVSTEKFAAELGLDLNEARQIILCLDERGILKSQVEGHHSIITPEGLCWMNDMSVVVER